MILVKKDEKMKYAIVYLLKGRVGKYQENIEVKLSKKFKIRNLTKRIAPHLTLKTPFEKKNIDEIERFLDKFSKKRKKFKIRVGGFGSFRKKVIYLNVLANKDYLKFQKDLIKNLRNNKLIYIGKIDTDYMSHSTIGFAKNHVQFERIMNFLVQYNPNFTIDLDSIAILKKLKNRWVLYKEFNLRR